MRTFDVETVVKAVNLYAEEIVGFEPELWLQNPLNIALTNANGDVALFENQADLKNTACAHMFFFSRGKQALEVGNEFVKEVFNDTYVETLIGLPPSEHKASAWVARKLGL